MKRGKLIIMITSFILIFSVLAGCGKTADAPGNTNGNLSNGGLAVLQDEWVYFSKFEEGSIKLYKIKTDGSGEAKVSDAAAMYLNVAGDWIYYIDGMEYKMYKMKTDGTGKSKLSDDLTASMAVLNDWIYYINLNGNTGNPKLCKIRADGSEMTELGGDNPSAFSIDGGWIYFVNASDDSRLYRMKTDGTKKGKLGDDTVTAMIADDGWIYYISSGDSKFYKMKQDGTGKAAVGDDTATLMNVDGGWIYYANGSDEDKLYKMKTDGSGKVKVSDDLAAGINIAGDWIYYINFSMETFSLKQIKIKADGTGRTEIADLSAQPAQTEYGEIYDVEDEIIVGDITYTFGTAYATNVMRSSTDPAFNAAIFFDETEEVYLFINVTATNNGSKAAKIGTYSFGLGEEYEGSVIVSFCRLADANLETLATDQFTEWMTLEPGQTAEYKLFFTPQHVNNAYKVYLYESTMEMPDYTTAVATVKDIKAEVELYTTRGKAFAVLQERFPESKIEEGGAFGYRMEADTADKVYYLFKVHGADSTMQYYFVKQETGEIYIGSYDENRPDFPAVPRELLEQN